MAELSQIQGVCDSYVCVYITPHIMMTCFTYVNYPGTFIFKFKIAIKAINDEVWSVHADERISFSESIMA